MCVLPACILHVCSTCRGHKRAPEPLELELWAASGCWELNLGPLQEQQLPLTTGLTLQPSVLLWRLPTCHRKQQAFLKTIFCFTCNFICFMCMSVLPVSLACNVQRVLQRASDPLELEFQMVMHCPVGAGNSTGSSAGASTHNCLAFFLGLKLLLNLGPRKTWLK